MNDILDELQRKAEEASPGQWFANDWQQDDGPNPTTIECRTPEVLRPGRSSIWPDGMVHHRVAETDAGERPLEDAAYIAAADPQTVLRLIAVARAAKMLYADTADYIRINNLGGMDNHSMRAVRQSLSALESADGTREEGTR